MDQSTRYESGPTPTPEPLMSTWEIFNSRLPDVLCEDFGPLASVSTLTWPVSTVSSSHKIAHADTLPLVSLNAEMVFLLNRYKTGVATWMDIFDHNRTYQHEVSRLALVSELLLRCICCFTAKHLSLIPSGDIWGPVATRYYTESLNLLIKQLNNPEPQSDSLTAVILLSSYEVLAAQGQEHRRHYEGAMRLIKAHGINASSTGLDRANFWIYLRHEIVIALSNQTPLQISPKYWNVDFEESSIEEDVIGQQLLWLVGRAINLTYGPASAAEKVDLMSDIESWKSRVPITFWGVKYAECSEEGLSKVHFGLPAAGTSEMPVNFCDSFGRLNLMNNIQAMTTIWYHFMYILLYAEPQLHDPLDAPLVSI